MKLLPEVTDLKHYAELFSRNEIWEPPVRHLAEKHELSGVPKRGVEGSHIVYRVGDHWIKIMAPLFVKDMAFEVVGLECVRARLGDSVPRIIAQGELEGWPYIILSHIEGDRIGDVWSLFSQKEKVDLARQIAELTRAMQGCKPNSAIEDRESWNNFIRERIRSIASHHEKKGLQEEWLSSLPQFIEQFAEEEFLSDQPVFLHADLTWDHFLVDRSTGKAKISGIIDFADCRLGHPEYDIPASAAFIFKGDRDSLREYLLGLGYKTSDLTARLSEKILAWTCLHLYSNLKSYFESELYQLPPGDYSALARRAFPLEKDT